MPSGPQLHRLAELSPEHRQMLLQKAMKLKAHGMLNAAPRMPPQTQPGPPQAAPPLGP
jgi:hypothetical protein